MTTFDTLTVDEESYELVLRWEPEDCQSGYGTNAKRWTEWHCTEVESDLGTYSLSEHPIEKWEHIFLEKYHNGEYQPA